MAGTETELGRRWPATPGLHWPDSGPKEHHLYPLNLSPSPNRPWRRRRTGPRGAPGGRAMAAAASSRSGENTPGIGQQTIATPSMTFRQPPRQTKHDSKPRELRAHRRPSSSALWRPKVEDDGGPAVVVDGKGQELSKSIKGKLMILRMRGIELGASEDDGFWQEQGGAREEMYCLWTTMKHC